MDFVMMLVNKVIAWIENGISIITSYAMTYPKRILLMGTLFFLSMVMKSKVNVNANLGRK